MVKRVVALALLALLALGSPGPWAVARVSAARQPLRRTFLAVMTHDGLMIPVAIYDGRDWWNRWPWAAESDEIKTLPVPQTIDAIPASWLAPDTHLPADWTLQRKSGPLVHARVIKPVRPSGLNLMDTFALETDLRIKTSEKKPQTEDDIGVAIAGSGELGRVRPASHTDSQRLLALLGPKLHTVEQNEIARWSDARRKADANTPPPVLLPVAPAPGAKSASPFILMKAERSFQGRSYYYLSGEKQYRAGSEGCSMNLSFDGVIVTQPDGSRIFSEDVDSSTFSEYCGDRGERMTPLASVQWADRVVWVIRVDMEDGYQYGLFDPQKGDTIALRGAWGTGAGKPAAVNGGDRHPGRD